MYGRRGRCGIPRLKGIYETYKTKECGYSQVVPLTMTEEKNTGTNLPAQIGYLFKTG
ncbi:MAG: hypothetical protein U5K79_03245 [Cyclobacteriaceae bacterium]|nr:hypothetical protein [Cyclobacteriaceae bacterium]